MLGDLKREDLRRTLVDAIDAGVAEETLGVIFGEIAGAAIDLDAGIDDAAAHFGCEHLERRGLAQDVLARIGDRKSVVQGKSVSVRVDLGDRRIINKKNPAIKARQQ